MACCYSMILSECTSPTCAISEILHTAFAFRKGFGWSKHWVFTSLCQTTFTFRPPAIRHTDQAQVDLLPCWCGQTDFCRSTSKNANNIESFLLFEHFKSQLLEIHENCSSRNKSYIHLSNTTLFIYCTWRELIICLIWSLLFLLSCSDLLMLEWAFGVRSPNHSDLAASEIMQSKELIKCAKWRFEIQFNFEIQFLLI